jgi:nucleotide-binding universal stress UspA family protein
MTPAENSDGPVLIAYDGSDFAKAAIADAARQLAPGRATLVLSVIQPLEAIPFLGIAAGAPDEGAVKAIVTDTESGADQVAEEGARLARDAGLDATALVEIGSPVWQRIVEVADERGASVIVIGSRGRSGLSYVLLGSVAAAVVQHSKRTVLVVHPSS